MGIDRQIYNQIKQNTDLKAAAEFYGIHISRSNKAICPFHQEKTPSMSFKGDHWKCFGCGKSGSVIDLVSLLYNITPIEAVQRINADINLGLDLEKPVPKEEIKQRRNEDELYRAFHEWEHKSFLTITDYLHELRADIERYKPKGPDEPVHDRYVRALNEIDYIDYLAGILATGEFEEKLELFKTCRREVKRIEQRRRDKAVKGIKPG